MHERLRETRIPVIAVSVFSIGARTAYSATVRAVVDFPYLQYLTGIGSFGRLPLD